MEKNKLQQQDEASKHNFCVPPTSLPFTEPARSSPARKQRKTLGWWWSYQEPIPCQWQTLSHTAVNSPLVVLPGPAPPGNKGKRRWPKSTPASFASLPGHRKHFFHSPQCKPIQKFSHPAPNRGVFQSEPGCKAAANTLFYPSWSAKGSGSLLGDTSNLQ